MLADLTLYTPQDKHQGRTLAKVEVKEKRQPVSTQKTKAKRGNWEMPSVSYY